MNALHDFEFFLQLCRAGSLSGAARELDVSPAATSKRLAGLERRLGVQLVSRNTRTMSLTEAGHIYLEEARAIGARIERLDERLGQTRGRGGQALRGTLRINASLGFGRKYMTGLASSFVAEHPEIRIDLALSDHPLDLIGERFDIGIRFGALPDSGLHARRIVAHRRLLAAAPAYLERFGVPRHPDALARHNCLILRQNDEAGSVWRFEHDGRRRDVRVAGNLSSNDGEAVVSWALAGHGIVQRAAWEVVPYLARGELIEVLSDFVLPRADISAVYHYRQFVPARVRAFIDFFEQRIRSAELGVGSAGASIGPA